MAALKVVAGAQQGCRSQSRLGRRQNWQPPLGDRAAPPLLLASHLDSQPTGGKFDGAAGVMAALEAVVSLAGQGDKPARDMIVVAWMNEEGSRFAPGMMGSEAVTGERGMDAVRAARRGWH